jgi:hypothetical protein
VSNGHDARGRFTTGNTAGRGNPAYRKMAVLRKAVLEEISEGDVRRLARKWLQLALEGDMAAATLLCKYCLGVPRETPDPDDMDADEWRRLRDVPSQAEFAVANIDGIPTEAAIETLQKCRQAKDPFAKDNRPHARFVLDEIHAQRKRRK